VQYVGSLSVHLSTLWREFNNLLNQDKTRDLPKLSPPLTSGTDWGIELFVDSGLSKFLDA